MQVEDSASRGDLPRQCHLHSVESWVYCCFSGRHRSSPSGGLYGMPQSSSKQWILERIE